MAADRECQENRSSGQSLIEFVLMLPVMFGMVFILVRVNSAIQVSIVNQKYSRQRALELAGNSAYYPALSRLPRMIQLGQNRIVIGVNDEVIPNPVPDGFVPSATIQSIARRDSPEAPGASDAQEEAPRTRARVRIRNTVELCTSTLSVRGPSGTPVSVEAGLSNASFDTMTFCSGGA